MATIPPALRKTTIDRVTDPIDIIIKTGMEEYSGWREHEHLVWLSDLTGLPLVMLIHLVSDGYLICTDEFASKVWLVSNDYYKSTARLLHDDEADCEDCDE